MEYQNNRFSESELDVCRQTDLVKVCESLGYKVKKEGNVHTIVSMDSLKIFNRRTYTRFSEHTGGSPIDFLVNVEKMEWKAAVEWLLDFNGQPHLSHHSEEMVGPNNSGMKWYKVVFQPGMTYQMDDPRERLKAPEVEYERVPFVLPLANRNFNAIKSYLTGERYISPAVVDFFIEKRMIYESVGNHNLMFVGRDKEGIPKHASIRGTYTIPGHKAFKSSVPGSDAQFSFNFINKDSDRLIVCEAPIDCMSYMDLFGDLSSPDGPCNYLALTGTHDKALERFLRDNPHIKIITLALDADEPGQNACKKITEKYTGAEWADRKFIIETCPPADVKDYNEMLVMVKNNQVVNM